MKQFVTAIMISIGSLSPIAFGNGADIVTSRAQIQSLVTTYQKQLADGSATPVGSLTADSANLISTNLASTDLRPALLSLPVEDYYLLMQEAKGLGNGFAEEDGDLFAGVSVQLDPETLLLFIITDDGKEIWLQPAVPADS